MDGPLETVNVNDESGLHEVGGGGGGVGRGCCAIATVPAISTAAPIAAEKNAFLFRIATASPYDSVEDSTASRCHPIRGSTRLAH
jgi:hypothetical protein